MHILNKEIIKIKDQKLVYYFDGINGNYKQQLVILYDI